MKCPLPLTAIVCAVVLYASIRNWIQFYLDAHFYKEPIPANCSEGRPFSEPLADSQIVIDDTLEDNDGQVRMQCYIPIHVYYHQTHVQVNGQARSHDAAGLEKLRHRQARVDIMCNRDGHPTMGAFYPHCSFAKGWTCFIGPCTAYEKARRLCASQIRKDSYPCLFVVGDTGAGVKAGDHLSYPCWPLAIALVTTAWLLQCCCILGVTYSHDYKDVPILDEYRSDFEYLTSNVSGPWCICFLGTLLLLGFLYYKLVHATHREPHEHNPRGKMTFSLGDISDASLKHENLVHISFWTLQWHPSLSSQVVMICGAALITACYQIWFSKTQRHHVYATLPQRSLSLE